LKRASGYFPTCEQILIAAVSLTTFSVSIAFSQPRGLMVRTRTPQPVFKPVKETKAQISREAAKKAADEWLKKRFTSTGRSKATFAFVGTLHGAPADELPRKDYDVFRMKFDQAVDIAKMPHGDVVFYFQSKELLWPPEQWPYNKPPPSQNLAVIRENLPN
jgi:hypothetical protein